MLLRQQSDLHKERDILRSSLESLADKGVEVETIITMQYNSQKMSETSLGILRRTVKNLREQIDDTTDELVRQTDAVEDAQRQVQSVQEQVPVDVVCLFSPAFSAVLIVSPFMQITLQEVQEKALMKKSVLLGAKLKQQQGMYETARNEKNSYSKSLIEVEAEISKITLEFRGMTKSVSVPLFRDCFPSLTHV